MTQATQIYVSLLEEGAPLARPVNAISLGNNVFKVLSIQDYNPECETWEFLPGTVVKCKLTKGLFGDMMLAVEKA